MNKLKINPLNIHGIRKVSFPATHFFYTNEISNSNQSRIDSWIYSHLRGRYYIGTGVAFQNNTIEYVLKIGFEVEKELSFFKLACPYI